MGKVKERKDAIIEKIASLKGEKTKKSEIASAVKKLPKAEYDALPKALQKELKDFR